MLSYHYREQCSSTNDEIISILRTESDGCALYTYNQVHGRGQYGNVWKQNPGENLAYTLAVKVGDFQMSSGMFNFRTAIVIRDFIANLTNIETKVKWPNDIILKGKKILGILIEKIKVADNEYYIIGVGVNVRQVNFENLPKAGSIYTQTNRLLSLDDFTRAFHQFLIENLFQSIDEELIMNQYNEHLFRKDEVSVFNLDGVRQNGIIKNATADGFLWIELEHSGLRKFYHKEIELLY